MSEANPSEETIERILLAVSFSNLGGRSMKHAMRILAVGAFAIATTLVTGLVSEAEAQSSTIVVRARGTAGSEAITLRVNNANVTSWTLTTSYRDYSVATNLTGGITVAFTNDATGRDVQVD